MPSGHNLGVVLQNRPLRCISSHRSSEISEPLHPLRHLLIEQIPSSRCECPIKVALGSSSRMVNRPRACSAAKI